MEKSWISFWIMFVLLGVITITSGALTIVTYKRPRRAITVHRQNVQTNQLTVTNAMQAHGNVAIETDATRSTIAVANTLTAKNPLVLEQFKSSFLSLTPEGCTSYFAPIHWFRLGLTAPIDSSGAVAAGSFLLLKTDSQLLCTGPSFPQTYYVFKAQTNAVLLTSALPIGEWVFHVSLLLTCPSCTSTFSLGLALVSTDGTEESIGSASDAMSNGLLRMTLGVRSSVDGGQLLLRFSTNTATPAALSLTQCNIFVNKLA